jgi:hypothetical protein
VIDELREEDEHGVRHRIRKLLVVAQLTEFQRNLEK